MDGAQGGNARTGGGIHTVNWCRNVDTPPPAMVHLLVGGGGVACGPGVGGGWKRRLVGPCPCVCVCVWVEGWVAWAQGGRKSPRVREGVNVGAWSAPQKDAGGGHDDSPPGAHQRPCLVTWGWRYTQEKRGGRLGAWASTTARAPRSIMGPGGGGGGVEHKHTRTPKKDATLRPPQDYRRQGRHRAPDPRRGGVTWCNSKAYRRAHE